jgi:hypothetical protein
VLHFVAQLSGGSSTSLLLLLHKGLAAEAQTDFAAATALDPAIADDFRKLGLGGTAN